MKAEVLQSIFIRKYLYYSNVESAPRHVLVFLKVMKIVRKNICFVLLLLLSFFLSFLLTFFLFHHT